MESCDLIEIDVSWNILELITSIIGYFNDSDKTSEDYGHLSLKHIKAEKEQDAVIYSSIQSHKGFNKIPQYSTTRRLTLGISLESIQEQWFRLTEFFKNQMTLKDTLKLKSHKVQFLSNLIETLEVMIGNS